MFNYNHLYYFYLTARAGGVTAAAEQLHISQPSLSGQLKVLEGFLGRKLFHKVGRKLQLTVDGQVVYGYCRRMFELAEEMGNALLQDAPAAGRSLHIGVSDEIDREFVVEVVSVLLDRPKAEVRHRVTMIAGSHRQLVERLRARELDAILTHQGEDDPELVHVLRAEAPVRLACAQRLRQKLALKSSEAETPQGLRRWLESRDVAWVMPSPELKLRRETDRFLESGRLKCDIVFESDLMGAVIRSVLDGVGVGLIPSVYLHNVAHRKAMRVLGPKEGYWKYRLWLTARRQNFADAAVRDLARAFCRVDDCFEMTPEGQLKPESRGT